jgi:hypothetical protein
MYNLFLGLEVYVTYFSAFLSREVDVLEVLSLVFSDYMPAGTVANQIRVNHFKRCHVSPHNNQAYHYMNGSGMTQFVIMDSNSLT